MTTKQLIEQTKRLIAFPSTTDNPVALQQAVDFIDEIVSACPGVTIERFERDGKPSLLAYRGEVRPEKFDILLNGHVDVVPGQPEQFQPFEKDGRLYGRGALDMKGTVVVLTDVFCDLVNEVPYSLGLQIVCDEEVGGYSGTRFQIDDGVRSDFVIMGEYANHRDTIYNAARGLCWAEIAFKGKEAHGGHLWNGRNAVLKASDFAAAVLERFPTPDKETWTTTASVASLSTPNETFNKVPDKAMLKIDFRFTQEDPTFRDRATVEAFIASIDPEAELVKVSVFEPAVKVEELNPYVQGLSSALRRVTKAKPKFLGRPGGSDGRHYALVDNDIVEFGLYGHGQHSNKEYVELSSFEDYRATLLEFLRKPIPARPKQQAVEPLHHQLLRQLVELPTTSGNFAANNKALTFIEDFLKTRGMHVQQFEREGYRSIVATTKPGNKKPTVLLTAHTDVVSAADGQFQLTSKGDKIFGRGVMDMKVAIASYLALVDTLQGELENYDFGIMITSDEEVGSRNGAAMLVKELGYRSKVAVVPDGGENWGLETFCKGVQWIRLDATGKNGHASRPWEGDSAIAHLLAALQQIETLTPADPTPDETFLSIGTIEGGTTANQIPDSASAMLDIRYASPADYKALPKRIEAICREHGIKTTTIASDPPCVNDPGNPYIQPFVDILSRVTGKQHPTSKSYGVTDGRHFSAIGIPCIVIEPPSGNRHQDGEWLSRKGFDQFCVILEEYVREMAHASSATNSAKRTKEEDVAYLAKRLSAADNRAYVWYATFGSGLSKENFMCDLVGGKPDGARFSVPGCRNKSTPLRDAFVSLPYELYFAGESKRWSGGLATLDVQVTPNTHTIARAYLISVDQFEDFAAQENLAPGPARLPLGKALQQGHATLKAKGAELYDELLYCGMMDGFPIFTLTARRPRAPYTPPSPDYARILCKGLSENTAITAQAAIKYLNERPGIAGHYAAGAVAKLFGELPTNGRS